MTWDDLLDPAYVDLLEPGLLVPHYLIHCHLYYGCSVSIISDEAFDELARRLDEEWDEVEHPHKKLIEREALGASGYYLKLPRMVKASAWSLYCNRPSLGFDAQGAPEDDPEGVL